MLKFLKNFIDEKDLLYCAEIFEETVCEEVSFERINKLQQIIKKQRYLLEKLCNTIRKLKENTFTCDATTQTRPLESNNLTEAFTNKTADALRQTGFVYEPTSGMYYDYNTGYYYNAEHGLYYDGRSGTYFYYNEAKKGYEFHSQPFSGDKNSKSGTNKLTKLVDDEIPKIVENEIPSAVENEIPVVVENEIPKSTENVTNETVKCNELFKPEETKKIEISLPQEDKLSNLVENEIPLPEENVSKTHKRKNEKSDSKMKKKLKSKSDAEEGECSEHSSESEADHTEKKVKDSDNKSSMFKFDMADMNKAWPPCMRIIVKETQVKGLQVGTLFMVTYDGGTLGREGNHLVLIPDLNISKYHAKFSYKIKNKRREKGHYTLTDLGSRNGTYVDGKRLSSALQESDPCPIFHDSIIRVGGTTLLCHVHPGRETCLKCEPGLLIRHKDEQKAYVLEENMSNKRKNELKKLKKKFGFKSSGENVSSSCAEYKDRAELRRQTVGSHSDSFKPDVACVTQPIKNTNKGFKMLAKMGWSEGESLGAKSDEGIIEPILVQQRADKVGLGYDKPVNVELDPSDKRKLDMWKKAQLRYQNLN